MTLKKSLIALLFFFTITKTFSQNDCSDAIVVCGNTGFQGLSATGVGIQELSSNNTCSSQENNSIWLRLSIDTGGTLGFILTPENSDIEVDFDFFIFGPNVTCGSLGQAIRCSTTNPEAAFATDNLTGLRDTETDTSEGPGALGNSFVQSLTVNNGENYFLVIDRPVGASNFSLTWTGTATFNQPPTFQVPTGVALDIKKCDNDGIVDNSTSFDLDLNTSTIIGTQTSVAVTYHISSNDVLTGENPITPSNDFRNTVNPQPIFARITNTVTGCFSTTQFSVEAINSVVIPNNRFAICDDNLDGDDQNGQATFTMSDVTNGILSNTNPPGTVADYYSSFANAMANTGAYGLTYYNTTPNEEPVFIKVTTPDGCFRIEEIKLIVNPLPATVSGTLVQCDTGLTPDGLTLFNLNEALPTLTGNDPNLGAEFFKTGSLTALPIAYNNTTNPETLDVKITNLTTGCFSWGTLNLNVNVINRTVTIDPQCDLAETGVMPFDLNTATLALTPTETAHFYANLNDALLEQNEITNTSDYPNATPYNATIYVRIEDANSCSGISPIQLTVYRLPQIETEDKGYVCSNLPNRYITLDAGLLQGNPADFTYEWSTTPIQTTPTIRVNEVGTYTVKVTNANNCSKTRTIEVVLSNNATIADVVIVDLVQNNTVTVLLDAASIGSYQYSLDLPNGPFQDSNYFENVAPGVHMVYVYDTHGCGTVSKKISVLKIPAFFTPNADGTNDTWDIIGISPNFFASSKIYIFDRFGKLLSDVDPKGAGWDGNYNGHPLPANDYWYLVKLETGRTIRGHFSLLR
ncbi:T9SS type B sorting domain-containing protein [Flavobacterium microcysteis]|uniref:T9SS type B sorting domain-containing protein n=1 Tax=Flavobacterium microcysteis TaxID=2596891 RepID=A0A501Q4C0_9FLAO|nr:T9SS type B sorting domain-containing protein [Flavobacterium microcysteis]TPD66876.1 T9SS type B sorting domain-containing protein [Flavobacterium microcysteis]